MASMHCSTYLSRKDLTILLNLSDEFERREQLKTLGAIIGCDAAVFTAGKIKKFMEIDPQHHSESRIRKSYGPLRRGLRFLSEQGFIRKRSWGRRTVYEVENWKKLEDYYHELLWKPDTTLHA
jgi:hypothetical protein